MLSLWRFLLETWVNQLDISCVNWGLWWRISIIYLKWFKLTSSHLKMRIRYKYHGTKYSNVPNTLGGCKKKKKTIDSNLYRPVSRVWQVHARLFPSIPNILAFVRSRSLSVPPYFADCGLLIAILLFFNHMFN